MKFQQVLSLLRSEFMECIIFFLLMYGYGNEAEHVNKVSLTPWTSHLVAVGLDSQ